MSGERLVRLEHAVTDLETRLEASEIEGASDRVRIMELELERARDRVRLEELERRYLALEHAVGVFAGTAAGAGTCAGARDLFGHVRRAVENGGRS